MRLAWFSDAIRRVPIEPHNYEMRAMLLLFRQGDTKQRWRIAKRRFGLILSMAIPTGYVVPSAW